MGVRNIGTQSILPFERIAFDSSALLQCLFLTTEALSCTTTIVKEENLAVRGTVFIYFVNKFSKFGCDRVAGISLRIIWFEVLCAVEKLVNFVAEQKAHT